MNYYYDIVLNFLENNYMFYEWDEMDSIDYIKKIPLFKVNSKTFNDFYSNNVKVKESFLKEIENKTINETGKLKYACILADKNNAFAYEFDDKGCVITRSALVLTDELSLLDYLYTVSLKEIDYDVLSHIEIKEDFRLGEKIKNFINLEIDKLYKETNVDKLKFLYLEWFNKKENDIDKIYTFMKNKLTKSITEEELRIYNIIKLSYNNV